MELIKQNGSVAIVNEVTLSKIEAFTARLNEPPLADEVRINAMAANSKYLPISFVRTKLDEMFAGLWNFTMLREQVIANEIIGVGMLEVFHPIAQTWIKRTGTAAVMIQQKSEKNGGSGRISNIDDKIKNTLVKDFPHLESECLKNAAKKLGKMFGGDLNRKDEDIYSPIYTEEANNTVGLNEAITLMRESTTKEDFQAIWQSRPELQGNEDFQKNYQYWMRKNVKP